MSSVTFSKPFVLDPSSRSVYALLFTSALASPDSYLLARRYIEARWTDINNSHLARDDWKARRDPLSSAIS